MAVFLRILAVDDDARITNLLKQKLEFTGRFRVRAVNDPQKVLETAREFKPDLVLLDLMMPELEGGDVRNLLRDDSQFAAVPVIFLTAAVKKEEIDPDGRIGGHLFVAKPVDLSELEERIDQAMKEASA